MGYAIKLGTGIGKRYEVACSDPVRGRDEIESGYYEGTKWKASYYRTSTLSGDTEEEYQTTRLPSISASSISTDSKKYIATDGQGYSNVIDTTSSRATFELVRRNKNNVLVPAYDIVLGFFCKVNLSSDHFRYGFVDYTKAKLIKDKSNPLYKEYPYIMMNIGHRDFSKAKDGTTFAEISATTPLDWIDTIAYDYDTKTGGLPTPNFSKLVYCHELTSFYRCRATKISGTTPVQYKYAWERMSYNAFNGSVFNAWGFKENPNITADIFNRGFGSLTKHNIFYSTHSTFTGSDKKDRLGFEIYTKGMATNRVKNAPVIHIVNYRNGAITFASGSGNKKTARPFLVFGIRECLK